MKHAWFATALCAFVVDSTAAADWPMFGGNPARSGYTTESLPAKLTLRWVVSGIQAPTPAWPVSNRLPFDRTFHPVIADGRLFYGSSADHQVRALDAATGQPLWSFFTNGPIRFAPAIWKDRVFVASDDGYLYCLAAADGKLFWKRRGGPDDRMLLGNDRMISRWPARGGPVVADDLVYFAAGIWPSEGVYLYALEPATGKVVWCNDDSGSIFMAQPHGGANAASGVAAQGYLVVNEDQLLVPTGRAVPAVFERDTGKFRYFRLQANGHKGGSTTLAIGKWFFNAGFTYDAESGKVLDPVGAGEVAAVPEGLILSTKKDVVAFAWADKKRAEKPKLELVRYKGLEKAWTVAGVPGGTSIVVAGKSVVCGGEGTVAIVDREAKRGGWSTTVDGTAYGLAVAAGRLYVSTDKGTLYCFDGGPPTSPAALRQPPALAPRANDAIVRAADDILKQSGAIDGYCLDLGCGDGALALELARRTRLHIIAVDPDPEQVALARRNVAAAGIYGTRVTVHQGDLAKTNYPRYFADLIVSRRSLGSDAIALKPAEVTRLQRPFGGVAMFAQAGVLTKNVRGPLEGAGTWTHQYADPGNTCCSTDTIVQGPLNMLWYRDSDLDGPSRHGRGPAPLFLDGRLFVEGLHGIRAVDAYNGRFLWEYALPNILKAYDGEHLVGTAATQSNYCVTPDGVYVRSESKCLRLDPATGKKLAEFSAPLGPDGQVLPWGYLASEGGLLFGSLANPEHIVKFAYGRSDMSKLFTESSTFFALDARTGEKKWVYRARHSIRHNAIAIAKDRVHLIDRPLAAKDRFVGDQKTAEHARGELLALDTATGKVLWKSTEDVYGTTLSVSSQHDVLLMSYQPTRFKLPSEIGGRLAGFRASTGQRLWDREASYVTRPLINGRTVYAQGGAWDLLTGDHGEFALKRSYGCGQLAGSVNLMVFRSATLGYFDLLSPKGVTDYGGLRPGCWINAIPAGGLVLVPDATAGCKCSYLNQAWVVLQPAD